MSARLVLSATPNEYEAGRVNEMRKTVHTPRREDLGGKKGNELGGSEKTGREDAVSPCGRERGLPGKRREVLINWIGDVIRSRTITHGDTSAKSRHYSPSFQLGTDTRAGHGSS
ncbi:Hypothetical protein NTJ_06996 [Nesidiocoris tenuis]|uniref:Uncharacterized protein n=1 Tax=Nesidiocoris tenuis TaxID=355587 RepID=A0ABN7AS63_9HEMI|nr:Hypothetical protein NTJ_06996 [Nesidiocoris tenuis]